MPNRLPLLAVFLAIAISAAHADSPGFRRVGTWGGFLAAPTLYGDLVVCGVGPDLVICEPMGQPRFRVVGRLPMGWISSITIRNEIAYVVCKGRIHVVSLAEPVTPTLLGVLPSGVDPAWGASTIVGDTLFARGGFNPIVLQAFDLSDPLSPVLLQTHELDGSGLDTAFWGEECLYLSLNRQTLVRYDLLPNGGIAERFQIDVPNRATSAVEYGDFLYVAAGSGLVTFDQSGDGPPQFISERWPAIVRIEKLLIVGDRLYIGVHEAVHASSLADPLNPGPISTLVVPWTSLHAMSSRLLVSHSQRGIELVDWPDAAPPRTIGRFREAGVCDAAVADGDVVYCAGPGAGLAVLDVSNRAQPRMTSHFLVPLPRLPRSIAISETHAYLGTSGGIYVLDRSDPLRPTSAAFWDSIRAERMTARGDLLLVGGRERLHVLDISQPTVRNELAVFEIGTWPRFVGESGDFVYITTSGGGLHLLDLGDRNAPHILPTQGHQYSYYCGVIRDQIAYWSDGTETFVYDVSVPDRPRFVTSRYATYTNRFVFREGHLLSLSFSRPRTKWFDITDPRNPVRDFSIATSGIGDGAVFLGDDVIDTESWLDGMRVFVAIDRPADIDRDGDVDLIDLARVLATFSDYSIDGATDVNCDSKVDFDDLTVLLAEFGS